MSGSYVALNPPPPRLGARAPGDTDPVVLDWTLALAAAGDTVASIAGVAVSRADGLAPGALDLTVTGSSIVAPTQVMVGLAGGIAGVDYIIACTIVRGSGPRMTRSAFQLVTSPLG